MKCFHYSNYYSDNSLYYYLTFERSMLFITASIIQSIVFNSFRFHSNKKGRDWLHTEKAHLYCTPSCAGWHYPYSIISNPRVFLLNNPSNLLVTGTRLATNSKNLSSKPVSTAALYGNTIRFINVVIVYWLFSNYSITIIIVIWFDIHCDSLMFKLRDKGHILAPTSNIQTQHFPQYMSCSK